MAGVRDPRNREPRLRLYNPQARRERDCLILENLAKGMTGAQIADDLSISESYLSTLIGDLRREFEAKSVAHLVAIALREGVIE
jgi:DNA-binding CsgD family transcriptional regulator